MDLVVLAAVAFLVGITAGAGFSALVLENRWNSERRDLINRIHAPSPGDYLALRQGIAQAERVETPQKNPDPVVEMTDNTKPWERDAKYEGIDIQIDKDVGVVHFVDGEDSWSEPLQNFLFEYGISTKEFINGPDAA